MPFIGEISALVTSFLWSGTSFAFASASVRIGPLQLNINRMLLASVLLLLTILIAGLPVNLSSTQIVNLVISGIIGLVLGDTFLFKAFSRIGPRLSMLLMSLSPAMSALLAFIFLDEFLSVLGVAGVSITITGIVLVIAERRELPTGDYKKDYTGIFYAVLGAAGQAGGLIFAKLAFMEGEINGFVATFTRIISSGLLLLLFGIMIRRYKNPVKLYSNDIKALTSTIAGTIMGPFLGITASLIAIANTKVGIAATLMSLMPVIMLPVVRYHYKEKLSIRAVAGAMIAVAGVAILFLR